MATVVSASRRSDIPSFYAEWFYGRLRAGFVDVANPYNNAQVRRVNLRPEDVVCFVFWTRDASPMLKGIEALEAYALYFHVTITGYGPPLEPSGLPAKEAIEKLRALAAKVGASRLVWRYDPVLLAGRYDAAWHAENFRILADGIGGSVRHCVISLYDAYRHSDSRLKKAGILSASSSGRMVNGADSQGSTVDVIQTLAEIAKAKCLPVSFCAEPELEHRIVSENLACIDARIIRELTNRPFSVRKDKNQRSGCNCIESVDIGSYGTCPRGCLYCYANRRQNVLI
ncbi:MAG: DUF1848 domain-containing protein [Rectinema sp.]